MKLLTLSLALVVGFLAGCVLVTGPWRPPWPGRASRRYMPRRPMRKRRRRRDSLRLLAACWVRT